MSVETKEMVASGLRDIDLDLARKMLAHAMNETTDMAAEQYRVPVRQYYDAARFDLEVTKVFKEKPIIFAFSCQLPTAGSYKAMEIIDVPVLLTRDRSGIARAFINVCRHRGNIVAEEGCGKASRFTCKYHGWTYGADGRLVGVRREDHFGAVDKSALGLRELSTVERDGIIYGVLTPGVRLDIDAWLGPAAPFVKALGFSDLHFFSESIVEGPNWKLCMDSMLEIYHFRTLHKETFAKVLACDVLGTEAYGNHMRTSFCMANVAELNGLPESQWRPKKYISDVVMMFPNAILTPFPEGSGSEYGYDGLLVQTERILPGKTVDRSTVHVTTMATKPLTTAAHIEFAKAMTGVQLQAISTEDYPAAAHIQSGLKSGANDEFIFGRNELCIHHWHKTLDRLVSG